MARYEVTHKVGAVTQPELVEADRYEVKDGALHFYSEDSEEAHHVVATGESFLSMRRLRDGERSKTEDI